MKTGSLRARVILTTLALLTIVLAGVVTGVTLAYQAKLAGDLRNRLAAAGVAVERAGADFLVKPLVPALALEGIAVRFGPLSAPDRAPKRALLARPGKPAGRIHSSHGLLSLEPTGRIEVQVRRREGRVEALVIDDGPGVPEHERQRIFARFVRLEAGKPGHGLGLAIARRIAQQHRGDLTCDPAAAGACFTLRLPARA
jgi:hypothetical protein